MTKTESLKCHFCQKAATAIKTEAEIDYSGEEEVIVPVELPICADCADQWYDGTEEFPGTKEL